MAAVYSDFLFRAIGRDIGKEHLQTQWGPVRLERQLGHLASGSNGRTRASGTFYPIYLCNLYQVSLIVTDKPSLLIRWAAGTFERALAGTHPLGICAAVNIRHPDLGLRGTIVYGAGNRYKGGGLRFGSRASAYRGG